MRHWRLAWSLSICAAMLAVPDAALAQPREYEPGSLLVFPFYDARPGRTCILTVTNLLSSRVRGTGVFREGDVQIAYHYSGSDGCLVFDRSELLTPGDTLSIIVSEHSPEADFGYAWIRAEDPETDEPIDFDYLIGDLLVVRPNDGAVWEVPGIAFRSLAEEGGAIDFSSNAHAFSDLDGNGLSDFDGSEYEPFPDKLFISRFFEESPPVRTHLILFSTLNPSIENNVDFLFWNNREQQFSRTLRFHCWWEGSLSEVSQIARNLQGDAAELGSGLPQTGWVQIDGRRAVLRNGQLVVDDPPILGMIIDVFGGRDGELSARLLHHTGAQDGGSL